MVLYRSCERVVRVRGVKLQSHKPQTKTEEQMGSRVCCLRACMCQRPWQSSSIRPAWRDRALFVCCFRCIISPVSFMRRFHEQANAQHTRLRLQTMSTRMAREALSRGSIGRPITAEGQGSRREGLEPRRGGRFHFDFGLGDDKCVTPPLRHEAARRPGPRELERAAAASEQEQTPSPAAATTDQIFASPNLAPLWLC